MIADQNTPLRDLATFDLPPRVADYVTALESAGLCAPLSAMASAGYTLRAVVTESARDVENHRGGLDLETYNRLRSLAKIALGSLGVPGLPTGEGPREK